MLLKRRLLCLLVVFAGIDSPLSGQVPEDDLRVLAFADTMDIRIEIEATEAARLMGAPVSAAITPAGDGDPLWSGNLGALTVSDDGTGKLTAYVRGLDPRLWSAATPHLYHLAVEIGRGAAARRDTVRFGFRSFQSRDGRLLLNGVPIFLRGNAINPPDRTLPESLSEDRAFAEEYLRYLKSIGVNIVRFTRHSDVWLDVADEVGMMVFQGEYGTPEGGSPTSPPERPLEATLEWYRNKVLGPLVNHPSVVIYVLSNEQAAPEISYLTSGAAEVEQFLTSVYRELRGWDPNRAYIGNAGYGFGRSGDVCDIHRYWGWYYNSFLSYYTLRDPRVCWRSDRVQPITLTENTGNYTGVDGRYNLVSASKQPDSQLNWTGHAPEREQAARALANQALVAKQGIEISRRIRDHNPYVAGLMPFTTIFHNWWEIEEFGHMVPKPVAEQYAISYQPVLLSWEMWTPQVYAGSTIHPVAHLVNDSESGLALKGVEIVYAVVGAGGEIHEEGAVSLPDVPYYGATSRTVPITLPSDLRTGRYRLRGRLLVDGDTISRNEVEIFVAARSFARHARGLSRRLRIYDPAGETAAALRKLGVSFSKIARMHSLDPHRDALLIGSHAWDDNIGSERERLAGFVAAGGRVLVLAQDPERFSTDWLPVSVTLQTEELDHPLVYPGGRPFRNGMAVNPERPGHAVFEGINRDLLSLWSDPTGWTEADSGFPDIYPVTQGFVLDDRGDLPRTAVLANYDHGLEGIALAELFEGAGSVLLSGFGITERAGLDPAADRLLINLITYAASADPHHALPYIDSPIVWGDYESERGLVTGVYHGLLLNTVPIVPPGLRERFPLRVDEQGFHFAGSGGGWNTKPSIQYVGRGRRPFGPFGFTLGGSVRLLDDAGALGEGRFDARIPAGRPRMVTTVWNPTAEALPLEIEVNGVMQRDNVPANATIQVETAISSSELGVVYRGDRRLVLMETDFPSNQGAAAPQLRRCQRRSCAAEPSRRRDGGS